MKKKILIALAAILLVNQSSWGQSYPPSSAGYNIDILVGNSASISVTGDEDGYSIWTSTNHGLLGTNAILVVSEADQYRKGAKNSGGVTTPFNVKMNPRDPNLSATGGYWDGEVFHVEQGTPVSFTINSADGDYWTGGGGGNGIYQGTFGTNLIGANSLSYSVNETGTQTYTWSFVDAANNWTDLSYTIAWHAYTIITSSNPANGGTTSGSGDFGAGTTQTVTASANPGFAFVNWTENGNILSTDLVYTFTLDEDRNLVANFEPIPYTITLFAYPDNGGSLSGSGVFDGGSEYTVTATPNPGFTFSCWLERWPDTFDYWVSGSESYTFTLTSDIVLSAYFDATTYTLTINNGTGSGSYTAGTVVSISANAAPSGQTFDKWTGDISNVADVNAANTTFTMGSVDATITATYKDVQYVITALTGAGGTIFPSGEVIVNQGASQTFTATPDQGKMTDQWLVNETVVQTGGNSYTVSNAQADATLEVTFKDNGMTIQNPESSGVTFAFKNGTLTVKSESAPIQKLEAYNLFGQLLKAVNGSGYSVEIGGLPVKQILIVKVVVENGEEIRRKIMD